jgi:hypothetical protein
MHAKDNIVNRHPRDIRTITQLLKFTSLEPIELLRAYGAIINELKSRGITRTKNNPVADYTEWLVSQKLGVKLESNSQKGYDATDSNGLRYQIKSRRITPDNKSTQLSALRNLNDHPFDFLIALIFEADFTVKRAAKIPIDIVVAKSSFRSHTNAHIVHLPSTIFDSPGVENILRYFT